VAVVGVMLKIQWLVAELSTAHTFAVLPGSAAGGAVQSVEETFSVQQPPAVRAEQVDGICGMSVGSPQELGEQPTQRTQGAALSGSNAAAEVKLVVQPNTMQPGTTVAQAHVDGICGMSVGSPQKSGEQPTQRTQGAVLPGSNAGAEVKLVVQPNTVQPGTTVAQEHVDGICGMSVGFTGSPQESGEQPTQRNKTARSPEEIAVRKLDAMKRRKVMDSLRPLQREALGFLQRSVNHAFIIVPTGSGKTTLIHTFKPKGTCSLVFAPFKILVEQLGSVLAQYGKVVSFPFVLNDGDMFSIVATADFIILPFEAAATSAGLVCSLNDLDRLGPIWVDEVHNLATTGRFRTGLDSFWNLGAELNIRKVVHRMVGLTATLRPDDVCDVMSRMSLGSVDVYRQSCFRPGLDIRFVRFRFEKDMIREACSLATDFVKEGKVLVFTSTVNLCDIMGDQIRDRFNG
jgi:hypothetical protein